MYKRWPVLAQILIALGCGGGLISLWAGLTQKNWFVAAFGLMAAFIFWTFYQLKPWAPRMVNALLFGLLLTDILMVAMKLVETATGCAVILFRGMLLYYFNTPAIKALFETESQPEEAQES